MTYTPKHNDKSLRTIYMILFFVSIIAIIVNGIRKDNYSWLYISIAMLSLVGFLVMLISFELTTYSYILNAKAKSYDFFVDRSVGKRGGYVCFYPLSDLVYLTKNEDGIREKLTKQYKKIQFNRYVHNIFSKNTYILVFKNTNYHDAVIIEPNDTYLAFLNKVIKLQKIELDIIDENEVGNNEAGI
ncbi:MAG: hypothetical protein IJW54_06580 [Clostridia bacterium]|nr:hypothetical protein [Clostridia bacterium]